MIAVILNIVLAEQSKLSSG